VHIVINFSQSDSDYLKNKYPIFTFHPISDQSHAGLIKYAFELGSQYDQCLFIEEDWLFNKQLSERDFHELLEEFPLRQIVFSKYRIGHELADAKEWGSVKLLEIHNKTYLNLETYFSLNPTIIKKEILQELCENFDWDQDGNSGPHLEMNMGKFLGQRFGPSILIPADPNFKVEHLGLLTATSNIDLILNNRDKFAEWIMRLHVVLIRIKKSNVLFRRINFPHQFTKMLER